MSEKIKVVADEPVGSIIYTVRTTGECVVDINLEDLEPENVELFAHLFFNITSGKFSNTTIKMIEEGLSENGDQGMYKLFLKRMQEIAKVELSSFSEMLRGEDSREEQLTQAKDIERKVNEEPCISPIDILRGG